ncbi:MAG: cyclic lactone autoinducer peptide [Ruminococcus sp.]|nr:cyclic lactone autoinducer peptide [Ruminococcus sp.]
MEFLAKLLSGAATSASSTAFTVMLVLDEPNCPDELL